MRCLKFEHFMVINMNYLIGFVILLSIYLILKNIKQNIIYRVKKIKQHSII